ncbi:MAG: aminotransferase class I/II-fold pyridoxal phosphate-dependent enzyme [Candidatus Marinimicrobia bacterium]|nr:aminotransferase class I/II-fold pyridoxal phosphate-dependent enzyme [Candidatus Neomarinimicrobiota bacterium]
MAKKELSFDTKVIHAGEPDPRIEGAVSIPIFQSSTFEYAGQTSYDKLKYIRLNNTPNHIALHKKLAVLEGAEAALVTSSGMSAITTSLLTFLGSGDHLLAHNTLYGGTADYVKHDLPKYGIEFDFFDATKTGDWGSKLKPNTKVIYVETITNPLMDVPELGAIVKFAKKHNLISMIDNTFASPVLYCPGTQGFDISLHSATKYLNGHTDIVAGVVIGNEPYVSKIKSKLNHLGGSLDPHACFLLHRGMKTLSLRMERQCQSAKTIARFLENHRKVSQVNFPGLESNPSHERAKEFLCGFGAMVSFIVEGGIEEADAVMGRLQIPICTASLGGVESLVTRPVQTSHSLMSDEELGDAGISKSLIRYSVGIESVDDLIADLKQALDG